MLNGRALALGELTLHSDVVKTCSVTNAGALGRGVRKRGASGKKYCSKRMRGSQAVLRNVGHAGGFRTRPRYARACQTQRAVCANILW